MNMYRADDLADYIIYKCNKDGNRINNLQLQKILNYIQNYYIQAFHRKAFSDDFIESKYGSVVPSVYSKYKNYNNSPITDTDHKVFNNIRDEDKNYIDIIIESEWQLR